MKRPPFIPAALVLFFVVLMTSLGFWQINRADEKRIMLEQLSAENITPINKISELSSLPKYSVVELTGRFNDSYQFKLDNQFHNKKVGVHIFTPFIINDLNSIIMVNRGWIPKEAALEKLPKQKITIKGRITNSPKVGIQLGEIEIIDSAIQTITYYEDDKINSFIKVKICNKNNCSISPQILWLDSSADNGLVREWKPVVMLPEKHIGYAVQWFSMTLVLILIFIYWLRKTKQI